MSEIVWKKTNKVKAIYRGLEGPNRVETFAEVTFNREGEIETVKLSYGGLDEPTVLCKRELKLLISLFDHLKGGERTNG